MADIAPRMGRPPKGDKKQTFPLQARLTQEQGARLQAILDLTHETISSFTRRAVMEALEREEAKRLQG